MGAFNPDTNCTLLTDLKAFYKLDEASGTRFDSITPGTGSAAQFVASNTEFLSIADNIDLSTGDIDFTLTAWVYMDTKPAQASIVMKREDTGASTDEYGLEYLGTGFDRFSFVIFNAAGTARRVEADNFGSPPTGTWIFVVGWHDSVNNTVNIQVNNGTINSAATTIIPADSTATFRIGAQQTPIQFLWDGRIDEVGFWKRILTDHERTDLYNSGNGIPSNVLSSGLQTSLISYWDLDETSGTRVDAIGSNDLTDNNTVTSNSGVSVGNSLTDNNTVTQAVGIVGNAGQFTSVNSEFLSHVDNVDLSMGDIDFTIGIWIFPDTIVDGQIIIAKWDLTNGTEFQLFIDVNKLRFQLGDGASGTVGNVVATTFGALSTGTWHFVTMWHDATANTVNIQVNNGTVDSAATTGTAGEGTGAFRIGANAAASVLWNGRVDETGLWKRVLTTQERTDLYNSGSGNTFDSGATCVIAGFRDSDMLLVFD